MYIIGLTGGIGCGKSTASSVISAMCPVVDADVIARVVVEPGAAFPSTYKSRPTKTKHSAIPTTR